MKPMRPILSMLLMVLALFVAGELLQPPEASARTRKMALVDDDWEPSEGKNREGWSRYVEDPEYEMYIIQALDIAGYEYDVYEIWPDGATAPIRPTLADLTEYPLIVWNCAANEADVLQEEELFLLVDYMNLGGKVLLSGQGILDHMEEMTGNPIYDNFQSDIIGVDVPFLNYLAEEVTAIPFGYFADLGSFFPQYSSLPDPDPNRVDLMWTQPFMDAWMVGFVPTHPDIQVPVSSDRFKWQPVHFQSFMLEAIGDPQVRADWIDATCQWLGFEGDNLYDFMIGIEDFWHPYIMPPQIAGFDPVDKHVEFVSHGESATATRMQKDLVPLGGDWRVGETFLVEESGNESHMTLMAFQGLRGIRVGIRSSAVWPDSFEMVFTLFEEGNPVYQDSFDGLAANQFFRVHLSHTTDTGSETSIKLMDKLGNQLWNSTAIFAPYFDTFFIEASGEGVAGATPISGWIDDLFFEGSLSHDGETSVPDMPEAVGLRLMGAHPNPFNPKTDIRFVLDREASVRLEIFDLGGRRVRVLLDDRLPAGPGTVSWNGLDGAGRPLTSGIYLAKFSGPGSMASEKLVLLK